MQKEDLEIELDVRIWDARDRDRVGRSIADPGTLPLRHGDGIRIEVTANRPVLLYLVWITSDGTAQPLYPWEPGRWDVCPAREPIDRLLLPAPDAGGEYGTWTVNSPPGLETVVVMARESPLFNDFCARLPTILSGFPAKARASDAGRAAWFECRDHDVFQLEKARLNLNPVPVDDPIFQIQTRLRDRLGFRFSLIKAVTLVNCGE